MCLPCTKIVLAKSLQTVGDASMCLAESSPQCDPHWGCLDGEGGELKPCTLHLIGSSTSRYSSLAAQVYPCEVVWCLVAHTCHSILAAKLVFCAIVARWRALCIVVDLAWCTERVLGPAVLVAGSRAGRMPLHAFLLHMQAFFHTATLQSYISMCTTYGAAPFAVTTFFGNYVTFPKYGSCARPRSDPGPSLSASA